jgi:hypothetical protein
MTVMDISRVPCEFKVNHKAPTLEVSIVGDWVLESQAPDLEIVLAQLGDVSQVKRLAFSTEAL